MLISGSSPHVRGTRLKKRSGGLGRRFIPACAGNTMPPAVRVVVDSVHPRMCGEHLFLYSPGEGHAGSSPHVRGTLQPQPGPQTQFRFIPACAGNTLIIRRASSTFPVHPRMCGEHFPRRSSSCFSAGSSPHVRGTHDYLGKYERMGRFIPACAGNTTTLFASNLSLTVHPRMCGEHGDFSVRRTSTAGSSPHVRGTRHH